MFLWQNAQSIQTLVYCISFLPFFANYRTTFFFYCKSNFYYTHDWWGQPKIVRNARKEWEKRRNKWKCATFSKGIQFVVLFSMFVPFFEENPISYALCDCSTDFGIIEWESFVRVSDLVWFDSIQFSCLFKIRHVDRPYAICWLKCQFICRFITAYVWRHHGLPISITTIRL